MRYLALALLLPVGMPPGPKPVAIRDATLVMAPFFSLPRGTVVLRDGLIEDAGSKAAVPPDAEVIDGTGLTVYAGFIDGRTTLGLPETKRAPEARKAAEGDKPDPVPDASPFMEQASRKGLRPELDAADLVHVDAAEAKKAHAGGFTVAAVAAAQEYLSGRGAVVSLSGEPRRNALIRAAAGAHASFHSYGDGYPGTTMGVMAHLRQFFLDARRYPKARASWKPGRPRPAVDPSLEAIQPVLRGEVPLFFEADGEREILRAVALSEEIGFRLAITGGAESWRVADLLREKDIPVVLSLKLPKEPSGKKDEDEPEKLKKERARIREEEARCARRLYEAKVRFCFSTSGLAAPADAPANLVRIIELGLPAPAALAALTTSPAKILGIQATHGTIQKGKAATLTVLTAPLGDKKAKVRYVFVDGRKFEFEVKKPAPEAAPEANLAGRYALRIRNEGGSIEGSLEIRQKGPALTGLLRLHQGEAELTGKVHGKDFEFTATAPVNDQQVQFTFKGEKRDDGLHGTVVSPMGEREWTATPEKERPPDDIRFETGNGPGEGDVEIEADRVPKTRTGGNAFIRDATILTMAGAGTVEKGSIHVVNGRIARVGPWEGAPPEGAVVIDAGGLFVMPGIIDAHSHVAAEGGLNESSQSVTPEVRLGDVLNPRDVAVYRAAAGGCTSTNTLHGSANTIGGQNALIKLKYGKRPQEILFPGAPPSIKLALGENPKQANWPQNRGKRFPNSRMGVEATLRRALAAAREYEKELRSDPLARRDLRLEALLGLLRGDFFARCHAYRADEILMVLDAAREYGFPLRTLEHVLEGYKVAPEMAAAGTGGSTFSDWWAYKIEAYDAIPHNAALMARAGVLVSINSDSDEQIRHLNVEAAKTVKYGGLSEREALETLTVNPARQLGIEGRAGSIAAGKDADLVLFNGHPLSPYSRCVMTLIDGEVVFEDRDVPDRSTKGFAVEKRPRRPAEDPPPPKDVTAIEGALIHPVSRPPFKGTIVIRRGKIADLGPETRPPAGAAVIDGSGLSVYPGLIDASTNLGLVEIGSVTGTRDDAEIGDIQPDLRALSAINPHAEAIAVTRANGITSALSAPQGGLICGQSALIRLDGWTPRGMAVKEVLALHVKFPELRGTEESKAEDEKRVADLRGPFEAARRYDPSRGRDLRLEALLPCVRKERPVVIHADRAREIRAAVKFAGEAGLDMILSGGREAWKVAALLAEKKVPVIIGGVMQLPLERHDPYDSAFSNAARLSKAGVRFAISSAQTSNSRNTPYHAAWAAAYGLEREEALKAVTLYPAQILGVADRLGSLEAGKDADLIVTTGDPLEVVTDVVYMFVAGRPVSLESRHTRLCEKFRARIEGSRGK